MIAGILLFILLLTAVPVAVGGIAAGCHRDFASPLFRWVAGQVILWAGFQVICVPFILAEKNFGNVVAVFLGYTVILVAVGIFMDKKYGGRKFFVTREKDRPKDAISTALWCAAAGLLLLQLALACVLAYEEGDDAFYVATSTITVNSDTMYQKLPYTGGGTGLDARHGLAPFPIWVAWLSAVTRIPAVTVAQVALPVALIAMSYAIYFMLGKRLVGTDGRKLPLFMILLETLVIFGGYSLYSAENFLLVRTAQGKSVLANIVIPFLFLLCLMILEELQQSGKVKKSDWALVALTMVTGCLCSTQGALLTCMLLGIVGVCAAVCYRRWKLLLPMAGCCVIPVLTAFLYFRLG
ncbi:MAG: DUF6077 domain-containing protein [Clostridium sp.]|nr:DUF6077 domain-containing protein [Acetatifactor muris]MCM1526717.1 DUF6077 domain-containing protein [Bacteroides sp.]MCM1562823.1 DUF6077 domain-containing protein [Clostridium sp.]